MLTADEIKQRLSIEDVIMFMEYFGSNIGQMNDEYITFRSICHGSESHKFYYYPQTKSFYCYVCGNIDIFSIIQQELDLTFSESLEWAENFFQLGKSRGFGRKERPKYEPREVKQKEIDVTEQLPMYNKSILNTFYDIPIDDWIEEGISIETLKQFEIKFDINTRSIIIPCYDMNDRLVGIRQRFLDKDKIEIFGKYHPMIDQLSGITYKFPTGKVLYGLNQNKKKIIESKQCVIFEGEKSVLKTKTWFQQNDISIASYGCNLTNFQIELIKSLGVETLIFMWDREKDKKILKKMEKTYKKCSLLFDVYYINDYEDKIDIKDSPTDKSEETYRELLNNIVKYNLEI